jgi:putative DNA primase/helicase
MAEDSSGRVIDLASARLVDDPPWLSRLMRSEGVIVPNVANAIILLSNDPAITGTLGFNSFTYQHLLLRAPPMTGESPIEMPGPYPRAWDADDTTLFHAYMQRVWHPRFARTVVEDALLAVAASDRFHPILVWLDGLVWDGKPRLDRWLSNAFDAEDSAYTRAIAAKFLIAAVRRLRVPGCKFDTMLILEGVQNLGKSTFCSAIRGSPMPSRLTSPAATRLYRLWGSGASNSRKLKFFSGTSQKP